jgi:hypothetical protein
VNLVAAYALNHSCGADLHMKMTPSKLRDIMTRHYSGTFITAEGVSLES